MKHAIVGSLTALLAGAGLALAQQSDIEYLPKPRTVSGPTNEVGADQGAAVPTPVPPAGDPGTLYGPPPPMLAPVCGTQGTPFKFWTEGDYHLWQLKQNHFPALLVAIPSAGLGAPGTQVLAGGNDLDRALRNGGGLTIGGWFTDYQGFGAEASFFVMESASKSFGAAGTGAPGSPIIVRPFFDVLAGQQSFAPVAVPGILSGTVTGETEGIQCNSGRFAGINADFIGNIYCDGNSRYDFLIGYRYLMLDDRFGMTTNVTTNGVVTLPGNNVVETVTDRINTTSRFNGADFGLRGQWFFDRWIVKATAKIAFGATDEGVDVGGVTTTLSATGVPSAIGAGFLARPSNSGTTSTEQFTVVPEFDLTLGYQVFDWMRVTVGYSFLYWSSVVRSGDQVNLNINRLEVPSLSPPTGFVASTPTSLIHCSDFWAHGLNVGLEFRY